MLFGLILRALFNTVIASSYLFNLFSALPLYFKAIKLFGSNLRAESYKSIDS